MLQSVDMKLEVSTSHTAAIGGLFQPVYLEPSVMFGAERNILQINLDTHTPFSNTQVQPSPTHNHRNICPCVLRETDLVYLFCCNYAWQTHLNLWEHERKHSIQAAVSDKRLFCQRVYILWMFQCVLSMHLCFLSEWM